MIKKLILKHIPAKGYVALTQWPFIFIREELKAFYNARVDNHEHIHVWQQIELGGIPLLFDLLYGLFYVILLCIYRNHSDAYRNNPFEQEAYANDMNPDYLKTRRPYAWIHYIFKRPYRSS
jgi:hypothetical protein